MLELAIADKPLFVLDERELQRDTPSWTAQTLQEWRQEQGPEQPLAFIIGQDSLLTFPTWHNYATILDNAHLIVCRRPGYPLAMKREKISNGSINISPTTSSCYIPVPPGLSIWRKPVVRYFRHADSSASTARCLLRRYAAGRRTGLYSPAEALLLRTGCEDIVTLRDFHGVHHEIMAGSPRRNAG
ncbi:Nicotinate-nucleotide adenylyltransferase (plasmid) [Klebsiella aerogenes]|nr:Nicotinate-nucleotide adenylyltransferase [Klebsiella aerogenes]